MLLTVSTLCKATELFGHSRLITVSQEPLQALLGCVLYRHITAAGSSAISSYTSGFFSFCSRLGSTRKKKLHKPRHHFFLISDEHSPYSQSMFVCRKFTVQIWL